ncbi:MAG: hypothetical protein WC551_07080 [Patescibacteria group bacterium]
MRQIFLLIFLLGLFTGPFCPLAAQAEGMDCCAGDRPMASTVITQGMAPDMPCCWVAPGQGQAADRETYKDVVSQLAVVEPMGAFPEPTATEFSSQTKFDFQRYRDKFETFSSNKRE